jgi:hypothetical protein
MSRKITVEFIPPRKVSPGSPSRTGTIVVRKVNGSSEWYWAYVMRAYREGVYTWGGGRVAGRAASGPEAWTMAWQVRTYAMRCLERHANWDPERVDWNCILKPVALDVDERSARDARRLSSGACRRS